MYVHAKYSSGRCLVITRKASIYVFFKYLQMELIGFKMKTLLSRVLKTHFFFAFGSKLGNRKSLFIVLNLFGHYITSL